MCLEFRPFGYEKSKIVDRQRWTVQNLNGTRSHTATGQPLHHMSRPAAKRKPGTETRSPAMSNPGVSATKNDEDVEM